MVMIMSNPRLILASTSIYRRELLSRLTPDFICIAPNIDESSNSDEKPEQLACRLAVEKAKAVANAVLSPGEPALTIGSDQVATYNGKLIGKPGNKDNAINQLKQHSGNKLIFMTGVCVLNNSDSNCQVIAVPSIVQFRVLNDATIQNYLDREPAYDCAGAFKSEGLGISLIEYMDTPDPTALIGLPLISLSQMLQVAGYDILAPTTKKPPQQS